MTRQFRSQFSQFTAALRLVAVVFVATVSQRATAAEIRLRSECQPAGNLVLLGDVAEIFAIGDEARQLSTIELGPAPAPGMNRFIRVREIQDLLDGRGVNLALHRFSGASQTTIKAAAITKVSYAPKPIPLPRATTPLQGKQAQQLAVEAIERYLQSIDVQTWQVKLQLTDAQVRQLQTATDEVTATGGSAPWIGKQRFVLSFAAGSETASVQVEAQVEVMPAVVVTTRPLARGAIIHAGDLALRPGQPMESQGRTVNTFSSIDEVVGMEAVRAIAAGQLLDSQYVRRPLAVRKGEVVTVYSRAAGIQVRTAGRASEDGSLGDVVSVESLSDRQRILARVTATQVVEVYARGVSVGKTDADEHSQPKKK